MPFPAKRKKKAPQRRYATGRGDGAGKEIGTRIRKKRLMLKTAPLRFYPLDSQLPLEIFAVLHSDFPTARVAVVLHREPDLNDAVEDTSPRVICATLLGASSVHLRGLLIAFGFGVGEMVEGLHHGRDLLGAVRMSAGSKPLRPWQVCAGDVIGSGKRVEYVFERYGELYINASDEELVRQGKRTYGEELTRLYDLDLSGWRVIGHYGCGRGYEGRSWYDMGKPFGRR